MAARRGHSNPIQDGFLTDTFKLVAETQRQAKDIAESARSAVRSFYKNPEDLARFIERHDTPVYVANNGKLVCFALWLLGYGPGYIAPTNTRRYGMVQWLLRQLQGNRPGCHFEHGAFVLTKSFFTVGFMSHQLHHWLACRSGMPGYSMHAQNLYRQFWNNNNGQIGPEVYEMSLEDMEALKAAINRDMEALVFLRNIANEVLVPGHNAQHLHTGKVSA